MVNTLDQIRAVIAKVEATLVELRAAEKVVAGLDNEPESPKIEGKVTPPGSWVSINHKTGATTTHPDLKGVTIGSAIMAALSDGPKNLGAILEHVNATGKEATDQSISSGLQILKRKNLVIRKGRMWRHR